MIEIGPMPSGGADAAAPVRPRLTERHVLALGLGVSAGFVVAALITAVMMVAGVGTSWAPIHLAVAGAGTVAIGVFMPHFAVTLAGTRPASSVERLIAIALLASGAAAVVAGTLTGAGAWAAVGAAAQVAGLVLVGRHTLAPAWEPLARRHHVVTAAYTVALAELGVGIILGGLAAAGAAPILAGWAGLRGTHAWLTLIGGVSLTIFATLVYLAPTVLGARIRPSVPLFAALIGILGGPPVAAAGFGLDSGVMVLAGAGATAIGALAQIAFVVDAYRRRGRFTSEHDWRRVAIGHLAGGTVWFAAATAVAVWELAAGRPLAGWSIGALAVPFVAGWMLQELVGSWTHLAPSVTPGDPARHARQRRVLAVLSRSRLGTWNAGVALLWFGLAAEIGPIAAGGGALLAAAIAVSVAALARALGTQSA